MKSRITRMTAALLAAVLSLSLLVGCKPKKELTRYTTIFYDVFDTVTQVIAYCESEEEFNTQMQALHQDLIAYNQLYDIYNDYDGVVNVKTINENAGKAPVQVDDRILSMLELADQMYQTTNGKLNIAMGSVLNIWHNYREAAEAAEAAAVAALVGLSAFYLIVGCVNFVHFLRRRRIAGVAVGVIVLCELAVCFLYLLVRRIARNAEDFIGVPCHSVLLLTYCLFRSDCRILSTRRCTVCFLLYPHPVSSGAAQSSRCSRQAGFGECPESAAVRRACRTGKRRGYTYMLFCRP